MALIEIDGLPIKNGGSFHGKLLNNQMVVSCSKFAGAPVHVLPEAVASAPAAQAFCGCSCFFLFPRGKGYVAMAMS